MSDSKRIEIPNLGSVPLYPASWYRFGSAQEFHRGPVSKQMLGCYLVGFKSQAGQYTVMEGRCSHMHSDLGLGKVIGETIQCPFHQWQYGLDGKCVAIPCTPNIPAMARQATYTTRVRHGQVYFFYGLEPTFELPFYDQEESTKLSPSHVFKFEVEAPWYMISINSVDVQHFRTAHDRRLLDAGTILQDGLLKHQASYRFQVEGHAWSDRLTRLAGGDQVQLSITEWSGNIVLAHARLQRAETFGMLFLEPLDLHRTSAYTMVFCRVSRTWFGRKFLDPLRTRIRAVLIHKFLQADVPRMKGSHVCPQTLISEDQRVVDYLRQLCQLPNGGII